MCRSAPTSPASSLAHKAMNGACAVLMRSLANCKVTPDGYLFDARVVLNFVGTDPEVTLGH